MAKERGDKEDSAGAAHTELLTNRIDVVSAVGRPHNERTQLWAGLSPPRAMHPPHSPGARQCSALGPAPPPRHTTHAAPRRRAADPTHLPTTHDINTRTPTCKSQVLHAFDVVVARPYRV